MNEAKDQPDDPSDLTWSTPRMTAAPMTAIEGFAGLPGALASPAFGKFGWALLICGMAIGVVPAAIIDVLPELVRSTRVFAGRDWRGVCS